MNFDIKRPFKQLNLMYKVERIGRAQTFGKEFAVGCDKAVENVELALLIQSVTG